MLVNSVLGMLSCNCDRLWLPAGGHCKAALQAVWYNCSAICSEHAMTPGLSDALSKNYLRLCQSMSNRHWSQKGRVGDIMLVSVPIES